MFKRNGKQESKQSQDKNVFDWEDNYIYFLEKSEKRAWKVSFAFAAGFIISCLAIAMMLPLKETMPYVIRQDNVTGGVDLVTSIRGQDIEFDEVQDRYWLTRYIRARESYDWSFITDDYLATREFSNDIVFKPYENLYQGANSPEKVYGSESSVRVKIISVTINEEQKTATVRFNKTIVVRKSNTPLSTSHWIATISYSYNPKTLSTTQMRDINPFGFTVEQYTVAPEADQIPVTTSQSNTAPATADMNN